MSWYNFGRDNVRSIDIKFDKELEEYYNRIRNTTTEQAKFIEPDVDESKELQRDWKHHPENSDFGIIKLEKLNNEIDPLNPPQIIRYENDKKVRIPIPVKIRKHLIKINNNICQNCKKEPIEQIHHLDKNPSNNELTNLIPLCYRCHRTIHKPIRVMPEKPRERITYTRVYEKEQEERI